MNPIIKINLPNKEVEGFWAVPTSGYGHICDEQPLPYLRKNNSDLSPRMGGEEGKNNYTEQIIPLPYGKLLKDWPIRQRFFNLSRKKINIYWRNIYKSRSNKKRKFLFYEQLSYKYIPNGFEGDCPILKMKRIFETFSKNILVKDEIIFKTNIAFKYIHLNPYIFLKKENNFLKIDTSFKSNFERSFNSSTGESIFSSYLIKDCSFKKNYKINYCYNYKLI